MRNLNRIVALSPDPFEHHRYLPILSQRTAVSKKAVEGRLTLQGHDPLITLIFANGPAFSSFCLIGAHSRD